MESSKNYIHPVSQIESDGKFITSVKISTMTIGNHTFDVNELGELLNELLEKKKFEKRNLKELKDISIKLSEGETIEQAYKDTYGVDILEK